MVDPLDSRPSAEPRLYRPAVWLVRLLERAFFRKVQAVGLEHVPATGGGVIVSWHPNGLVDPALILTRCPRRVVFGARHGLFRWPILGRVMRELGTVPIYRASDLPAELTDERRSANRLSLDALAARVAAGELSALFPEGVSHDKPHPVELRTGAARLYYRALELTGQGAPAPRILPVGLHYDKKKTFRSDVLVWFHAPLAIEEQLVRVPANAEEARAAARRLTARIEEVLGEVVQATDDWETYRLLHRARKLLRAEAAAREGVDPGRPDLEQKVSAFARIRQGYYALLVADPERVAELRERVEKYAADLDALGIQDHHLDRPPRLLTPWLGMLLLLQAAFVFLLLPPLLLVGYAVNLPPYMAVASITRVAAKKRKDVASLKILIGALVFPLAWIVAGVLGALAHAQLEELFPRLPASPEAAGGVAVVLAIAGGLVSLEYVRVARETARAVRIRLTRARRRFAWGRLRVERRRLYDAIMAEVGGEARG